MIQNCKYWRQKSQVPTTVPLPTIWRHCQEVKCLNHPLTVKAHYPIQAFPCFFSTLQQCCGHLPCPFFRSGSSTSERKKGAVKTLVSGTCSLERPYFHIHFAALQKHAGSGAQKPSDMPVKAEKPSKIEAPESTAASLRGDSEEQELADDLEELEIKSSGTAS